MCSFPAAYERDLEADIIGDTSGHFRKMLVVLLQVGPPWGPPRALCQGAGGCEHLLPVFSNRVAREGLLGGSAHVKSSLVFCGLPSPSAHLILKLEMVSLWLTWVWNLSVQGLFCPPWLAQAGDLHFFSHTLSFLCSCVLLPLSTHTPSPSSPASLLPWLPQPLHLPELTSRGASGGIASLKLPAWHSPVAKPCYSLPPTDDIKKSIKMLHTVSMAEFCLSKLGFFLCSFPPTYFFFKKTL